MSFASLKAQLLSKQRLFEDRDFPAAPSSIYFSKKDPLIHWRRPHDIARDPKFIVDKATRFDFDQGSIGNCWYIAAAATLATRPGLLDNVVPSDQTFNEGDYCGMFHFFFWRYGTWVEVIIDDQLPCRRGTNRLMFCSNREEKNEFWTALLEKAYAKLHGSYEALEGGWTEDAYVDFTGGVGQRKDLKDKSKIPDDLFRTLLHDYEMKSLMACSISATQETMESILDNGLVIGHAYSITKVAKVSVQGRIEYLLRIRNPWGSKEWKGAWSDSSKEWRSISDDERKRLGIITEEDGEFWMSFADFVKNYEELQVCHLPAGAKMERKKDWKEVICHGSWVKGVSAGGCGNPPNREMYWTNPQYAVTLTDPDEDDDDKKCTLIVSLMQKHARSMRTRNKVGMANIAINFDVYQVKGNTPKLLEGDSYSKYALKLARRGGNYSYYRELTQNFRLKPGTYVVIPATFDCNVEMNFLLRMYTEKDANALEMDIETAPILAPKSSAEVLRSLFEKYAGNDGVVDARELQLILNAAFERELGSDITFELEAARSMLAMQDRDESGVLEYNELSKMWAELTTWQGVFKQFDRDNSGLIDVKELKSIFKSIGYSLSRNVLGSIVKRYAGKGDTLAFNDFIMVITKVVTLMEVFCRHSKDGGIKGKAKLTLDQFMHIGIYF